MFSPDARLVRLEIVRDRADKRRDKAIMALGGVCPGCKIETDPRDLKVIPLTEIAKKWSKQLLFRRIIEDLDPMKLARLVCKKCHFNEVEERRLMRVKAKRSNKIGMFYWIGGVKVEEGKRAYSDLGVEYLEKA